MEIQEKTNKKTPTKRVYIKRKSKAENNESASGAASTELIQEQSKKTPTKCKRKLKGNDDTLIINDGNEAASKKTQENGNDEAEIQENGDDEVETQDNDDYEAETQESGDNEEETHESDDYEAETQESGDDEVETQESDDDEATVNVKIQEKRKAKLKQTYSKSNTMTYVNKKLKSNVIVNDDGMYILIDFLYISY
jgi:hypothetical protein